MHDVTATLQQLSQVNYSYIASNHRLHTMYVVAANAGHEHTYFRGKSQLRPHASAHHA